MMRLSFTAALQPFAILGLRHTIRKSCTIFGPYPQCNILSDKCHISFKAVGAAEAGGGCPWAAPGDLDRASALSVQSEALLDPGSVSLAVLKPPSPAEHLHRSLHLHQKGVSTVSTFPP